MSSHKEAPAISNDAAADNTDVTAENTIHYLPIFPYLGTPHGGYYNPSSNAPAS